MSDAPAGLSVGGVALWHAVSGAHDLDATQEVQLLEACRAKDRLDRLDEVLQRDVTAPALAQANATANLMKQLLAALRLPDVKTGVRPQYRGSRVQLPSVAGGKVSSLDRARSRSAG